MSTTDWVLIALQGAVVIGFIALGVSLLSLLLGQLVFKKLEGRFAQDL